MSLTLTRRHNVDRFGYLIPTRYGNVPMVGAVATYRPGEGRFGRGAVAVEEGTTNLLGTLSPKTGATVTTEITHYTNQPVFYCDGSVDYQGIRASQKVTLTAGTEYTFSVYVYNPSTGEGSLNIQVDSDEVINEAIGRLVVPPGPGWHRIVQKWSPPADRSVNAIRFENRTRAYWQLGSNQCYMTAPQVEAKPFATSFVNGTRARGVLHYDGSPISVGADEGTFSMWMYVDVSIPRGGGYPTWPQPCRVEFESGALWCRSYDPNQFDLLASTADGAWTAIGGRITNTGWHLWTATWSDGEASLYIDGRKVGSKVLGDYAPSGRLSKLYVGCGLANPAVPGSLFDEVLVLPYAASEEEILSWYEAQGPLPPHPQAAFQWDWQAVRPAQMVKL